MTTVPLLAVRLTAGAASAGRPAAIRAARATRPVTAVPRCFVGVGVAREQADCTRCPDAVPRVNNSHRPEGDRQRDGRRGEQTILLAPSGRTFALWSCLPLRHREGDRPVVRTGLGSTWARSARACRTSTRTRCRHRRTGRRCARAVTLQTSGSSWPRRRRPEPAGMSVKATVPGKPARTRCRRSDPGCRR